MNGRVVGILSCHLHCTAMQHLPKLLLSILQLLQGVAVHLVNEMGIIGFSFSVHNLSCLRPMSETAIRKGRDRDQTGSDGDQTEIR